MIHLLESGSRINHMDLENINGVVEISMRESGRHV